MEERNERKLAKKRTEIDEKIKDAHHMGETGEIESGGRKIERKACIKI